MDIHSRLAYFLVNKNQMSDARLLVAWVAKWVLPGAPPPTSSLHVLSSV